jgi:hypothetical protein
MSVKYKNNNSLNQYDNLSSYSDGDNFNNINNLNGLNDNIVVTAFDIDKKLSSIEIPSTTIGINTQDSNVKPCLIVSNKNKNLQNTNNTCVGNGRTKYASIDLVTPVASLVQNSASGNVQPNVDDINVSISLDRFASAFKNNTLNDVLSVNTSEKELVVKEDNVLEVATSNVIKSEIVDNVQKTTENIIKLSIADDVQEPQLSDVSKTVATNVASSVENKLSSTTTQYQTVNIDNLKSLVHDCVYNNLSKLYDNPDDAKNASVTIINQAFNNVDPQKYKLMIEIATSNPDSTNSITTVASDVSKAVTQTSIVTETTDKVVIKNVNPSTVVEAVKTSVANNDKINFMISTIKQCAEPQFETIKFPNHIHYIAHCEDNNKITNELIDKITKNITNTTISNLSPLEHFTQYNNKHITDYSNNIVAYDTNNNRISINEIIRSALEHMIGDKTVTAPPTTIAVNSATVTKDDDKKTVTVIPAGNCNCSEVDIKKLCTSIAQNTGAKQIDVTSQTDNHSNNAMIITVKEPVASDDATVKSVLDAVNTVVIDKEPTKTQNTTIITESESSSKCYFNIILAVILAVMLYILFIQKKNK